MDLTTSAIYCWGFLTNNFSIWRSYIFYIFWFWCFRSCFLALLGRFEAILKLFLCLLSYTGFLFLLLFLLSQAEALLFIKGLDLPAFSNLTFLLLFLIYPAEFLLFFKYFSSLYSLIFLLLKLLRLLDLL